MSILLALFLTAAPSPSPVATTNVEPVAAGEALAAAFERTTSRVDGEVASEIVSGGYRIGLVIGPPRPIRPRSAGGRFTDPVAPDNDQTFIGAVVRDARTKRFLPEATVTAILEYEGGGDTELRELVGAYPLYGDNLRVPRGAKGLRGVTIVVGPPEYDRHAEMLAAFTGEGTARFEIREKKGGFEVVGPKRPTPHAADWTPGNDLRQAVGESRSLTRQGEWLIGFIAEGPEPYWFWKGKDTTPEHCAVKANDTNHLEAIVVHEPTGLMVTSATAILRFSRPPTEHHDFLLRPLLAEFFHYGGNFEVPVGKWTVNVLIDPPGHDVWGEGTPYVPERRLLASGEYERKGVASVPSTPQEEAKAFADRLAVAAQKYGAGEREAAADDITEAFFDFEGSRLDARLRAADPGSYKALEHEWIGLRAKAKQGARPMEVGVAADRVGRALVAYAAKLEEKTSSGAFVQSLLILVREGVEAILVLGLLVAVLRKTKRDEAVRLVWSGAVAGLGASLLLGVAFVAVIRQAGAAQEGIEGIVNLLAMGVLFFTSFWLISRVEGKRWAQFIKQQIEGAVTGGRRTAIVSLAFLVVFREGAETVLMYTPLVLGGAVLQVLLGISVATLILILIFIGWVVLGMKFPIRPFFAFSGALLYVLAFKFAGDGITELQGAGWLSYTEAPWIPKSSLLQGWLGVHPSLESAALQAVLILAVLIGLAWTFLRKTETPEPRGAVAG